MKKGFTLIELLAVIIVLAIIALIATPIVLDVIKDSKDSAARSSAHGVLHSANYYYAEEYMKNNGSFREYECSFNNGEGCDLLFISGDKPTTGSLSINKDGNVNGKIEFDDYVFYICNSKVLEEESSECSFIEYEKIYAINENGIITGFKTNDVASILDFIIPTVNATDLTDEAEDYFKDSKITIPEYINGIEVKGIADNAFSSYEITEVTILSNKVITIGANALPTTLIKLRVNSCLVDKYNLNNVEIEGIGTCDTVPQVTYKCKRATQLHTETCSYTSTTSYCSGAGYTLNGTKKTTTITYGNLGTKGTLNPGDAYDCDINGNGNYGECTTDENGKTICTERFYYVSDLYNTTTNEFVDDYKVLIYYNNTIKGEPNTSGSMYTSSQSAKGPRTAITNLPKTTQWSNISLSNTSRAILTEAGDRWTSGGTTPSAFSYEGYAARLLTYQEVASACGEDDNPTSSGELDNCNYLMENTKYSSSSMPSLGPWLETPYRQANLRAWFVTGEKRSLNADGADYSNRGGVRPVIEVSKTDIEI